MYKCKKYKCQECAYETFYVSNWKRHLQTKKHQNQNMFERVHSKENKKYLETLAK